MNIEELFKKREYCQNNKELISEITIASYEQAFEIEYTHNSTAIEGNTLTLIETKLVLEDEISVGRKNLREIYEQVNHQKAFRYIKECINKEIPLDEKIMKDIHAMLMQNIIVGGVYRNIDVYISGAQHTPPTPNEMYKQIKNFCDDLTWKNKELNPIELAAWTHAEFVKIYPFPDGNGRTARLIMNYQLMFNEFFPISISKENRLEYFNTLEEEQLDRYVSMIKNSFTN